MQKSWESLESCAETDRDHLTFGQLATFQDKSIPKYDFALLLLIEVHFNQNCSRSQGRKHCKKQALQNYFAQAPQNSAPQCAVQTADTPRLGLQTHLLSAASPLQLLVSLCASFFLSGCLTVCLSVCLSVFLSGWMTGST